MSSKGAKKPAMAGQPTLATLFSKPKAATETVAGAATVGAAAAAAAVATTVPRLTSAHPEAQAFYDSLSPHEATAHRLAITCLGTSYDVTRTNGFVKWKKARA